MTDGPRSALARQFRLLIEAGTVAGLTDGQLLERFRVGPGEAGEAAFAALMAKHGPMVLGVCRRALADPADVADAFQATFLVLVRKAGSIRVDDSLGRWLYGVSRRVAHRARAGAARKAGPAVLLDQVAARTDDPDRFELSALLDEELSRLPATFRAAIVLCDLEGLSLEEAARDLVCPVGTIKSRLARGRRKLRERLERRGLTPASLMTAPVVPAALAEATARSAMVSTGWGSMAAGVVPASAAMLAQEVLKAMGGFKLKMLAATAISLGLAASGVGVVARGQIREGAAPAKAPQAIPDPDLARLRSRLDRLDRELGRAVETLAKGEKVAQDPTDPAVVRGRAKAARLAEAIDQIDKTLASALGDGPEPAKPGPAPTTGRKVGLGDGLPGEDDKVSMPAYVVEQPDIILVEVLDALPDRPITGERLVQPDGKISLGFYGEVYVAGLTVPEIKEKVTLHLRQYLDDKKLGLVRTNPATGREEPVEPSRSDRVFVEVESYNSKVYYVQGDVGSPGRLPITGNETVLDALNYAGGLTPSASKVNIRLIRPALKGAGTEKSLPVDLAAIVDRGETKTNYQLFPGDRLIVFRDPAFAPKPAPEPPDAIDVEVRLQTVERKLDDVLKALERLAKP